MVCSEKNCFLRLSSYRFAFVLAALLCFSTNLAADWLLVPMDKSQTNHLRGYGLTYYALAEGMKARWLLNYQGGAFLIPDKPKLRKRAILLGVRVALVNPSQYAAIKAKIAAGNMNNLLLEKAPRMAVYAPGGHEPWDDAVTLVLRYAGIKYTRIYDREVLSGALKNYDWLHIHHEDFTGQYGKFYAFYRNRTWYRSMVARFQKAAYMAGFKTVAAHKLAVARAIQRYVRKGGFLFAMCSATETIDVALAAGGLDIIAPQIDGSPLAANIHQRLNFKNSFAFAKFRLYTSPYKYAHSTIDVDVRKSGIAYRPDYFRLFNFSAKIDPVPAMLVQNHVRLVKGFLGQTTAYRKECIKNYITVLGSTPGTTRVKYIHGSLGDGSFTFLGGHDPEDYRHHVGDPPTNLDLYPSSPGYRLILNNVLFPVAERKERKT